MAEEEVSPLAALEMRIAEQDRTIEDLSDQLARQWTVIDRMQKALGGLTDRFATLEEAVPAASAQRPPHW